MMKIDIEKVNIQALVNAQVCVNRAVFESSRKGMTNPLIRKEPDSDYILNEVKEAIIELRKVEISITNQPELFD